MESETSSFATKWQHKLKNWYNEYRRILTVTKKPTKEEFLAVVKISGLGILAIGLVGFIIQMIKLTLF